ncbi:MAG: TPM domain-containing protein, partial [Bacteroidia bacterium]|nr:TPM domain-containing protein [Bacteroidia bacterium]
MKSLSLFVILLWAMRATALALEVPPSPSGFVNDYAGVLRPDESRALERFLRSVHDSTSNEIAVAIFPSLEGEDVAEFTFKLAHLWGVGDRKNQNGVLVAVFVRERKVRIEVGYGLEAAI